MGEMLLGICGQIEWGEWLVPGRDADSGPSGMMDDGTESFSWGGGCERAGDQVGAPTWGITCHVRAALGPPTRPHSTHLSVTGRPPLGELWLVSPQRALG